MGEKWKRSVKVVTPASGAQLEISTPKGGNPGERTDSPTLIRVKKKDRKDGGAEIHYHSETEGLQLTGFSLDAPLIPDGLSAEVKGGGEMLWLTDRGGKGVTYNYRILGSWQGMGIESPDPEIHNEDDDG